MITNRIRVDREIVYIISYVFRLFYDGEFEFREVCNVQAAYFVKYKGVRCE